MSNTIVRNYTDDDLGGIINFYNSSPMKGPFFARNKSFLRHFMHYPGVQDGIFIAQKDGEIEGIAIVSISEKENLREGKIIELWSKSALTTDVLVQEVLQYCGSRGVDRVLVKPPELEEVDRTFRDWIRIYHPNVMAKPLSVLPILKALLDIDSVRKCHAGKSLVFILDEEIIRVEVTRNGVEIGALDGIPQNSAVWVTMTSKAALEIVFSSTNPCIAYLARKVRIRGLRNVLGVLRLLYSVRIKSPWHVALVDDM